MLVRGSAPPVEASIPRVTVGTATGPVSGASSTVPVTLKVTVHVAGAVARPGVYSLFPGARVVDAVTAAGGATSSADLERINLAQLVIDTEQVYIPVRSYRAPRVTVSPRLRPTRTSVPRVPAQGASTVPEQNRGSTKIDINVATAAQLDALPGVGPATSKAIVSYRSRKGPFAKIDDLMNVPGIGPAKFAAMRDLVTV